MKAAQRAEVEHMARYVWKSLIALCERLCLREKLRFKTISAYIELPFGTILTLPAYVEELYSSIM